VGDKEIQGLPLAYILGKKEFWSLEFRSPPQCSSRGPKRNFWWRYRSERQGRRRRRGLRKSGAVRSGHRESGPGAGPDGILWHRRLPRGSGIARLNARSHGVEDRISFHHGDLLGHLKAEVWKEARSGWFPILPMSSDEISVCPPASACMSPVGLWTEERRTFHLRKAHPADDKVPEARRMAFPGVGDGQGEAVSMLLAKTKGSSQPFWLLMVRAGRGSFCPPEEA